MWPFARRRSKTGRTPVVVRARYDAAQTTPDNVRHWANADGLSADAAASPEVRKTLRNRARYEAANNSYAKGIILTLANDVIGTGPRLQVLTENQSANRLIEQEFSRWTAAVGLAEKLRTMRMAKATDGEAFAMLTANPALPAPVKLDVQLIEADRVFTPTVKLALENVVDGIEFDQDGNPVLYYVSRQHPGDAGIHVGQFDRVEAEAMIHWFRPDRPGQHRGVPEITPALPLFAQLRRYTLAVLGAAETAADFAAVLFTDAPASGEAQALEPMDVVELEKRVATVLPDGWKLGQVEAQQPSTSYAEFKREILNEIARCLNMPYNIAACNSSGYNYASGRLDHQTYFKSIRVEQTSCGAVVLDRILDAWLEEAALLPQLASLAGLGDVPHQWFWDGHEHVDPAKEASAQATRLASHTTTLAAEYARQGKDWETEVRQRAKEVSLMKELGLTPAQVMPQQSDDRDADDPEREDMEEDRAAA
ncbi:MAG: hypothetical protein AMXMBFR83_25430 [Phycisphaerae bacterium]